MILVTPIYATFFQILPTHILKYLYLIFVSISVQHLIEPSTGSPRKSPKKAMRYLPSAPSRILDAPGTPQNDRYPSPSSCDQLTGTYLPSIPSNTSVHRSHGRLLPEPPLLGTQ
jgi:hypothetical protein